MLIQAPLYQASWMLIPGGPFHTASRHAILGIMRSLHFPFELQGNSRRRYPSFLLRYEISDIDMYSF